MLPQQYCLRWKYHHSNLQTMFSQLLDRGCFCDVTLACEGQLIRAHRVVLCACSTYFDTMLTNYAAERDPIIIMKDAKFADIKCLIEFMYKGEINVEHSNLASLLKTAEELKIKGLAEVSWREEDNEPSAESDPKFAENIEPPPPPPQMVNDHIPRMPLLTPIPSPTNQETSHPGPKRKRGRPPLDEEYDVFNAPKISYIQGPLPAQYCENSNMDETSTGRSMSEMDGKERITQDEWAEQHVEEHHEQQELEEIREDDRLGCRLLDKNDEKSEEDEYEDSDAVSEPAQTFFLTAQEQEEWKDVIKMDAYLAKGRRPQFWEEAFTKRVMEAIKSKDLEMKKAAQILGVSYGTLYGRYRETYGCLKHPYRGPSMVPRYRDMWNDKAAPELIGMFSKRGIDIPGPTDLTITPLIANAATHVNNAQTT